MSEAIGIDLGTTYSAAARVDPDSGRPAVIPSAEGGLVTPSVVWCGCEPPAVGESAKAEQRAGAADVAAFFKRGMGDPHLTWFLGGREYTPVALSTLVLKKIKADAEAYLKASVTDAVITVPAYFDNRRREATIEAGTQAGLNVLRIINEPTAAALAYGVHKTDANEVVLVYDLGGGTFDVTLVKITPTSIDVLATDGDHELGGKDWDDRVARYVAGRFREEHGRDPLEDSATVNEVLTRCEDAKRRLSGVAAAKVNIECGGIKAGYEITRAKFEELTIDLMERTQQLTEQVLRDAGVQWTELAGVLPVGGSTQMPMVHDYVRRMSGKPPRTGVPVEQAVALGAAVQAAMERQAKQPSRKLKIAGEKKVTDVMSHSLGMISESADGARYVNSIIIGKNKPIPCTQTRPYQLRTSSRVANVWEVYLTQGEFDDPTKCSVIGKYRFTNVSHVQGKPAVLDVVYEYSHDGMVKVSATERSTGKALPMTVEVVPEDMSWLTRAPEKPQAPSHVTAYLAFDLSGSMSGTPLAEAQRAAREFIARSDLAHMSIGVISFADSNETTANACQDARALERAVSAMHIGAVGYGNSASPFAHTHQLLRTADNPRYLIVLTDGVWNDQPRAVREAKACHADGIEVIAIGFGGADRNFLRDVATSDEGALLTDLGGLVEAFSTIAQEITENAGDGQLRLKKK